MKREMQMARMPLNRQAPRIPEKVVQQQIVNALRARGAVVFVLGTRRRKGDYQGTNQTPGIPDLQAFLPPPVLRRDADPDRWTPLWVEVKADGGQLRTGQAVFRQMCQRAGVAHVVGGVDEVLAFLVAGGWLHAENVPHYRRPAAAAQESEC